MSKPTREELIETIDRQEREILRMRQEVSILQATLEAARKEHKHQRAVMRERIREASNVAQGSSSRG